METRRSLATEHDTMAPSALDLFILTFNCAKNLVNTVTFASDLRGALSQNATGLPELVVFSLQEVAPMSYSFLGSHFLSSYYSRFEEALNVAAVQILVSENGDTDSGDSPPSEAGPETTSPPVRRHAYPYTLVRAKNVGMTAIMLFSRSPASLHHIEEAECGFGSAGMGNKGAVGLRLTWSDGGPGDAPRTTELTFVATHLTAMEWNLEKRNSNWRRIVSGLTFQNPKDVMVGRAARGESSPADNPNSEEAGSGEEIPDTEPLLGRHSVEDLPQAESLDPGPAPGSPGSSLPGRDGSAPTREQLAALQNLSIFKPTSHLFLAGDLNYRIDEQTPASDADFPSFDPADPNHWAHFLHRDQLLQEKAAGRTLHGMSEADVTFGPSYKYTIVGSPRDAVNAEAAKAGTEVPWKWAPHRWPSWCDRILYLDQPPWVRRRREAGTATESQTKGGGGAGKYEDSEMVVKAYNIMPLLRTSDHRPVFLRVQVPLIGPIEMTPPEAAVEGEGYGDALLEEDLADPRVSLPVPIDVDAWDRRASGRRNEIVSGLSMFLWGTREGAMFMATAVLVGVGAWWLWTIW